MPLLKKGFTLIEILVVIVIIAILSSWALMSFDRFIERSRASDAENLIGLAANAQGRQIMRKGRYTLLWTALDAPPLAAFLRKTGDYVSEDGTIFLSKGGGVDNPNNGFKMYFEDIFGKFFIVADRVNWHYKYTLVRPLQEEKLYCIPSDTKTDKVFCMEFMNVDTEDALVDPRSLASGR